MLGCHVIMFSAGRNKLAINDCLKKSFRHKFLRLKVLSDLSCARVNFINCSSARTGASNGLEKWTLPRGHSTNISIYNTLTKNKVPLILKNKSLATWYMCGPTVYDSAHLGHACCYVKFDIIRKILENYFNLNVLIGMSVTDIDDKIINRSQELKEDFKSVSSKYEKEFWEDMKSLNVAPPHVAMKVTKHVDEIISFISKLLEEGNAYAVDDGSVYFNTDSYSNYGKFVPISKDFSENTIESHHDGKKKLKATILKKSSTDFALWKGSTSTDEPGWPSPWGRGRPGWHIECSAMASKLFGSNIDIHSGGIDLMFPHHENEDAQSCCYHGVPQWVNYWIYTGHLYQKGQSKMSKSLKNTLSIQDFLSKYTPNQFRMFCLLSHYRNGVEYTEETMGNAVAVMGKVESFLADANACLLGQKPLIYLDESEIEKNVSQVKETIKTSLADDFNTPAVMSSLIELMAYTNKIIHPTSKLQKANLSMKNIPTAPIASVSGLIKRTLENFGIVFKSDEVLSSLSIQKSSQDIRPTVNVKDIIDEGVEFRSEVRNLTIDRLKSKPQNKEEISYLKNVMNSCDKFRQNLSAHGITVKDHGKTSSWTLHGAEKKTK